MPARPHEDRLDRFIVVFLRRRNLILETARNDSPFGMHDTNYAIAIIDFLNDNTEAENVGQLLESDRFPLHLAPPRIRLFLSACDSSVDASCGEFGGQLLLGRDDDFPILPVQIVEPRRGIIA